MNVYVMTVLLFFPSTDIKPHVDSVVYLTAEVCIEARTYTADKLTVTTDKDGNPVSFEVECRSHPIRLKTDLGE